VFHHKVKQDKIDRNPKIKTINNEMPLSRVAMVQGYQIHLRHILKHLKELMKFHGTRRMKRLRQVANAQLVGQLLTDPDSELIGVRFTKTQGLGERE